jgi:hypothetical protein
MEQIHALLLGAVCIAAAFVFWLRKRSQTDDDDDIEVLVVQCWFASATRARAPDLIVVCCDGQLLSCIIDVRSKHLRLSCSH